MCIGSRFNTASAIAWLMSIPLQERLDQKIIIMPDLRREGHYEMMGGVCLSLACLDLTRGRKGLGNPKLAGLKPITRVTRKHIYKLKGQSSRSPGRLMQSQTMHHTQFEGITIFLKLACYDYFEKYLDIDGARLGRCTSVVSSDCQ